MAGRLDEFIEVPQAASSIPAAEAVHSGPEIIPAVKRARVDDAFALAPIVSLPSAALAIPPRVLASAVEAEPAWVESFRSSILQEVKSLVSLQPQGLQRMSVWSLPQPMICWAKLRANLELGVTGWLRLSRRRLV